MEAAGNTGARPGQVWAINDPREAGRQVRVERVEGGYAYCTIVANSAKAQKELDQGSGWFRDRRGKATRIRLDRFRAGSDGYTLVSSPPQPPGG